MRDENRIFVKTRFQKIRLYLYGSTSLESVEKKLDVNVKYRSPNTRR